MFFRTNTMQRWLTELFIGQPEHARTGVLFENWWVMSFFSLCAPCTYTSAYYTYSLYSLFYFYDTAPYNSPPSDWTRYQRFRRDIKMSWSRMLNPIKVIENIKPKLLLYIARRGFFIEPKKNKVLCIFLNPINPSTFCTRFQKNNLFLNDQFQIMYNSAKGRIRMHIQTVHIIYYWAHF